MANEWQVESEYVESLTGAAVTPAQVELGYAEALTAPAAPPPAQVESAYVETLHTLVDVVAVSSEYAEVLYAYVPTEAWIASAYAEVLSQVAVVPTEAWVASVYAETLSQVVVAPPASSGHVYDSTGARRPVWLMTPDGLQPVDLLTKA